VKTIVTVAVGVAFVLYLVALLAIMSGVSLLFDFANENKMMVWAYIGSGVGALVSGITIQLLASIAADVTRIERNRDKR